MLRAHPPDNEEDSASSTAAVGAFDDTALSPRTKSLRNRDNVNFNENSNNAIDNHHNVVGGESFEDQGTARRSLRARKLVHTDPGVMYLYSEEEEFPSSSVKRGRQYHSVSVMQ